MTRKDGGLLLAETLRHAGVEKVFALHGGHLEALFRGCVENDIELVDFRHESSAGHAAEAYARVTGKLGVCVATAGPGFTNAVSAIANAQLDGIPVLFIIGAPPLREAETNALQGGLDQMAMSATASKWAHRITNTERIPDITAMAIRKAVSGRKGAVVLELPIDVLHMTVNASRATTPTGSANAPRPHASPEEISRALDVLHTAKRPAIVCGIEAAHARCGDALAKLAEIVGAPVFATARGMGVLPAAHRLNGQIVGNLALLGNVKPDAILLLGQRLGLRMGGRGDSLLPRSAALMQVQNDAAEMGRIRDIAVAISADSGAVCEQLSEAATLRSWPERSAWCEKAVAAKNGLDLQYPQRETQAGIHPYHAAKCAIAAAGKAIFVLDGGEAASWAAHHVRANEPGEVIGLGYLGCLGTGPGHAIGAQIAAPSKRVVQITGDGAMGFHVGEFDIMARRALPIVTVVLNNEVWGMSIHGQQIMYGESYSAISKLGNTHYARIAEAFGCHGERVSRYEDIGPAMERAFNSGKPACVEIMTDPDAMHPVTSAALGMVEAGSGDTLIPYYENIPAD